MSKCPDTFLGDIIIVVTRRVSSEDLRYELWRDVMIILKEDRMMDFFPPYLRDLDLAFARAYDEAIS